MFYAQVFLLLAAAAVIAGLVIAQLADPFEDITADRPVAEPTGDAD